MCCQDRMFIGGMRNSMRPIYFDRSNLYKSRIDRIRESSVPNKNNEYSYNPYKSNSGSNVQTGSGFFDLIRTVYNDPELYSLAKKSVEYAGAKISNAFPSSDEYARDLYPGEYHALLRLKEGYRPSSFGRANWQGPGTNVLARLKDPRGSPPRTMSDMISYGHDLRYSLAGQNTDKIREADNKMLKSLEYVKERKLDYPFNINSALAGIRGKVLAEDFGYLTKGQFIKSDVVPTEEDKRLLKQKLNEVEQYGVGLPGDKLLMKLARREKARKRKIRKPGMPRDKGQLKNKKFISFPSLLV